MNQVLDRAAIEAGFREGGEFVRRWSENVRIAREAQHLSKTELARRAGISQGEITRFESGERAPGNVLKCVIAAALNMPVDRLFPMPTAERLNELYLSEAS